MLHASRGYLASTRNYCYYHWQYKQYFTAVCVFCESFSSEPPVAFYWSTAKLIYSENLRTGEPKFKPAEFSASHLLRQTQTQNSKNPQSEPQQRPQTQSPGSLVIYNSWQTNCYLDAEQTQVQEHLVKRKAVSDLSCNSEQISALSKGKRPDSMKTQVEKTQTFITSSNK